MNPDRIPLNHYPKKSLESKLLGKFINWFYYSKGPFPKCYMNSDGFVPLKHFVQTKSFGNLLVQNKVVDLVQIIMKILNEYFELELIDGEFMVRKLPWPSLSLKTPQ